MYRITLHTQCVSAACGMNQYYSVKEITEHMVYCMFPDCISFNTDLFEGLLYRDLKRLSESSGCLLSGYIDGDVENCVGNLGIMCCRMSLEKCNTKEKELLDTLCSGIRNQYLRERLENAISFSIATNRIKFEKPEKCNLDTFSDNTIVHMGEEYAKEFVGSFPGDITLLIVGTLNSRLDGHVVYTAQRLHPLLKSIPLNEKVELEICMWLTDTQSCTHIEKLNPRYCYNGKYIKEFGFDRYITIYKHNPELLKCVFTGLQEFEFFIRKKIQISRPEE